MNPKGKINKNRTLINHHFIFIEAPIDLVGPQAVQWGESNWWPVECSARFSKISAGPLKVGTRYQLKIHKPFMGVWEVDVTRLIPNQLVERTFRTGIFYGFEVVFISERSNGTRIDYELHYQIRGLFNKIMWKLFGRKEHNRSIRAVLKALREYSLSRSGPGSILSKEAV